MSAVVACSDNVDCCLLKQNKKVKERYVEPAPMWWSKKDTVPAAAVKPETFLKKHGKTTRNRSTPQGSDAETSEASLLNTAETNSGFEVHFVNGAEDDKVSLRDDRRSDKSSGTREISGLMKKEVPKEHSLADRLLSIENLMAGRRKVHRSQYSSHGWDSTRVSPLEHQALERFVPRPHRVPLYGNAKSTMTVKPSNIKESLSLLQRYDVSSELCCLEEEIKLLDVEVAALKNDRTDIDVQCRHLTMHVDEVDRPIGKNVDPHRLLLGGAPSLPLTEKRKLQELRGLCLTLRLSNEKCREFLLSKCGFKTSFFSQFVPSAKSSSPIALTKQNCGEDGPAASIQHINLVSDDSLFLCLDSAKSFHHGRLPERLYRRLQPDQSMNQSQLLYVTTGPFGCYYAEFRTGKVIWGIASDSSESDEFATLCRDWNISRVAFGPFCVVHDSNGIPHKTASWVILSREGRAAWKNVPSRLHRLLENRMASQAAPVEVSLGCGDSYFVRFLDGTVDYCLPAHIASVIEEGKLDVTSISLHPELPHDFLIRHH